MPDSGLALKILMSKHDLSAEVSYDNLKCFIMDLKNGQTGFRYRDIDQDNIPEYGYGDESGDNNSDIFRERHDVKLSALLTFLSLLDESLGDIVKILDLEKDVEKLQ